VKPSAVLLTTKSTAASHAATAKKLPQSMQKTRVFSWKANAKWLVSACAARRIDVAHKKYLSRHQVIRQYRMSLCLNN
jgi:hypothetical protein